MIAPMLSLALSVYANPGIYAVLLGSGVSKSAGIPTGWDIVLDLIRKIANLYEEDCEPDPITWYKTKFGENPDYSNLLDMLAKSPSERNQLLRHYFEPTSSEREQGVKLPTAAHKSLAKLVAGGDIRVIVTTNFDHLIEDALVAEGINPTVISTADAAKGAPPLAHSHCVVIKPHGDYLDMRIKNTATELASYLPAMKHVLDRVLDEFGLIVCGWSADWDIALRSVFERCQSYRYSTYWTSRGNLGDEAQRLIALRRAQVINIVDADSFILELSEKVESLRHIDSPHPLSAKVAAATVKSYLVDERYRIRLHDLFVNQTTDLRENISDEKFPTVGIAFSQDVFKQRIERYESVSATLIAMLIEGSYWGEQTLHSLWCECLERITGDPTAMHYDNIWTYAKLYVPLLLLYAAGISALAARRYDTLAALLAKPTIRSRNEDKPLLLELLPGRSGDVFRNFPGLEHQYMPASEHLFATLREPLREHVPSDMRYQQYFDQFEYLFALVVADMWEQRPEAFWAPIGCFGWRDRMSFPKTTSKQLRELLRDGDLGMQLLNAGLFGESPNILMDTSMAVDKYAATQPWLYESR